MIEDADAPRGALAGIEIFVPGISGEPPHPLDEVAGFVARFVAYPSPEALTAHVLWIAHTHLMDAWVSTPRLAFLSPEPGSGKTRAMEITNLLVPRPVEAVNVTPAYLFRKVDDDDGRPTILFDEIDTVFGPRAKDNEDIRGLLNAGHRKGAVAGRCVVRGKTIETEEIPAYCAVALAGLGNLPDTILSRAVVVRMRRRAPGESVQPYRPRFHEEAGHRIRETLGAWADRVRPRASTHIPEMLAGVEDRDADVWEPLLVVAELVGGEWPQRARVAAVTHVTLSKQGTPSLGIRLLDDLRTAFGDAEKQTTRALLDLLHAMEEAPWGDLRGKPLDERGLARRLSPYGIGPTAIRTDGIVAKGYKREDFHDAWSRYLSPLTLSPHESVTSVTTDTPFRVDDELDRP